MKSRIQNIRLLSWILLFVFTALSSSSQIQLAFSGTPTPSGTPGTVGAQYTYANIGTTGGVTIRGVIQIIAIDGAGLGNIDAPGSAGGAENAFQPVIYGSKASGSCWSIQFRLSFFNASTGDPLTLSSFRASGIDIDGNDGTLREHNTFYVPYSYTLNNPTNLSTVANSGLYRFQAPSTSYSGISLTQPNVAVTCLYNNRSSVDVSIGSCCVGGACSVASNAGRQHSINFYDAVTYTNPVVLPMKLSSFSASPEKEGIALQWKTIEEISLARFILQKSSDGINYSDEAVIIAKGSGNTYNYFDQKELSGKTYYRLKCEDIDGKITYSSIVYAIPHNGSLNVGASAIATSAGFKLFINSASTDNIDIGIADSYGNLVGKFKNTVRAGNNVVLLNNDRILSKGVYFINIISSTGGRRVVKVMR